MIELRQEMPCDYRETEHVIREAFGIIIHLLAMIIISSTLCEIVLLLYRN